jgi:hypothetical protein
MQRIAIGYAISAALVIAALAAAQDAQAATFLGQTSTDSTGDCFVSFGPYTEIQQSTGGPPSYTVPAGGGVITSWNHQSGPDEAGQLELKIYRPTVDPTKYIVVGHSALVDLHPNALDGGLTRISVQAGDVLGYTRATSAVMHCLFPTASASDVVTDAGGIDTADGQQTTFSGPGSNLRINMAAVLEPDADHDGFGDETQDQCPTNASTQGPCPATGQRAAALKLCKKRAKKRNWPHTRLKKCKKKARLLPV